MAPQIHRRDVSSPQKGGMTFAGTRHIVWALNTSNCVCGQAPVANAFSGVFRAEDTSGSCKLYPISVKRNLEIEANVVVSEQRSYRNLWFSRLFQEKSYLFLKTFQDIL